MTRRKCLPAFPFGFPIDLRRFASSDDLDWFTRTMTAHFGLVVVGQR